MRRREYEGDRLSISPGQAAGTAVSRTAGSSICTAVAVTPVVISTSSSRACCPQRPQELHRFRRRLSSRMLRAPASTASRMSRSVTAWQMHTYISDSRTIGVSLNANESDCQLYSGLVLLIGNSIGGCWAPDAAGAKGLASFSVFRFPEKHRRGGLGSYSARRGLSTRCRRPAPWPMRRAPAVVDRREGSAPASCLSRTRKTENRTPRPLRGRYFPALTSPPRPASSRASLTMARMARGSSMAQARLSRSPA